MYNVKFFIDYFYVSSSLQNFSMLSYILLNIYSTLILVFDFFCIKNLSTLWICSYCVFYLFASNFDHIIFSLVCLIHFGQASSLKYFKVEKQFES